MELSIVIPCYNEEDNIKKLLKIFKENYKKELNYEVIFVDNGSTDLTFKILEDEIKNYKNFKIIKLKQNQGYGGGIIAGIQEAKGDILSWTHADIQTNPIDIFKMYFENKKLFLNKKILIKGSRKNRSKIDLIFTKMMSIFVFFFLNIKLDDINAQPKIFPKILARNLNDGPKNFLLDLYILIQSKINNFEIISIENNLYKRNANKPKGGGSIYGKLKLSISTMKYILLNRKLIKNGNYNSSDK